MLVFRMISLILCRMLLLLTHWRVNELASSTRLTSSSLFFFSNDIWELLKTKFETEKQTTRAMEWKVWIFEYDSFGFGYVKVKKWKRAEKSETKRSHSSENSHIYANFSITQNSEKAEWNATSHNTKNIWTKERRDWRRLRTEVDSEMSLDGFRGDFFMFNFHRNSDRKYILIICPIWTHIKYINPLLTRASKDRKTYSDLKKVSTHSTFSRLTTLTLHITLTGRRQRNPICRTYEKLLGWIFNRAFCLDGPMYFHFYWRSHS